ncbi:HET-domain-containing protein [Hypoxylon crocopeplum]|nr:HET-domain-containing protein [Hypoxylon crocopeplum]
MMDIQALLDQEQLEKFNQSFRSGSKKAVELDEDDLGFNPDYDSTRGSPVREREEGDKLWIDTEQVKAWIKACDKRHGDHCQPARSDFVRPYWLIDVKRACLVRAPPDAVYVALSYVWGTSALGSASSTNLDELQKEGSLLSAGIPLTIRHIIQLLPLLDETYLWVDRLCIIQDDDSSKQKHINNMAHIYSNARMTVVMAAGEDANHGLRGIPDISPPRRDRKEDRVFFNGVYPSQTAHQLTRFSGIPQTKWYSRGWTLQEIVFSRRTLYFTERHVFWECHCGTWTENSTAIRTVERTLKCHKVLSDIFRDSYFPPWPNLHMYLQLVAAYNNRELTFDTDILAAFAGITTSLSSTFHGGFLFGLPELFLDVALLWRPLGPCRRRRSQREKNRKRKPEPFCTETAFPSWSWVGWQAEVDPLSWKCGYDYIKNTSLMSWPGSTYDSILKAGTSYRLKPTVRWYIADGLNSPSRPVIDGYKTHQGSKDTPTGWTRYSLPFEGPEEAEYIYHSDRRTRFCFPIPMPCGQRESSLSPKDGPFLYCKTTRAYFYLEKPSRGEIIISLLDEKRQWAGVIRANLERRHRPIPRKRRYGVDSTTQLEYVNSTAPQEFISISEGNARNDRNEATLLEEWNFPRRPRTEQLYEFVHVLWVKRVRGICYRKGVGRVLKSSWLEGKPESVEVTLG